MLVIKIKAKEDATDEIYALWRRGTIEGRSGVSGNGSRRSGATKIALHFRTKKCIVEFLGSLWGSKWGQGVENEKIKKKRRSGKKTAKEATEAGERGREEKGQKREEIHRKGKPRQV